MSFILESLKKSEKQREDITVPNLHTVHEPLPPAPKKRLLWPYLVVAGLLLNAGILLWFLLPGKQPPVVPLGAPPINQAGGPPAQMVHPLSVAELLPPVQVPAPELEVALPVTEVASTPAVVALTVEPTMVATPISDVVEGTRLPEVEDTLPPEVPPPVIASAPVLPPPVPQNQAEPPLETLADLPYSVSSRLPPLQISVFAYSQDPASRLVRINNRILREGSFLDVGLLLDEITPNELIFSFEGYRFRVPKQ